LVKSDLVREGSLSERRLARKARGELEAPAHEDTPPQLATRGRLQRKGAMGGSVETTPQRAELGSAAVLDSMSELVAYLDLEMRYVWVNRAGAETVGLTAERLTGRYCYKTLYRRSKPCPGCPVLKARESGQPQRGEMTSLDGRVWFIQGNPTRDESDNITGMIEVASEITERKRMEEALRESEQRYRTLVETSPDAITVTGLDINVIMVNQQAAQLYGFESVAEVLSSGKNALDFIAPEDRQRAVENARETLETGVAKNGEYSLLRKDGSSFPGEVAASLIRDAHGKPKGFIAVTRDISERKRAEEALRESEAKYRQIFENVQDIFYRTDAQGIITEISPSVERYGYTREGLIGTQVLDVYEDPEERSRLLEALFERGEVVDYEIHLKTGDGRAAPTSVSTRLLRDADGTFAGAEGILRDIGERKRAEEALRENEAKYHNLFEASRDAIFIADASTGQIVDANEAASALMCMPREQIVGMNQGSLHPSEEVERYRAVFADHVRSGKAITTDIHVQRPNGERVPVDISASTFTLRGRLLVQGVFRDVTEKVRPSTATSSRMCRTSSTGQMPTASSPR
jgi:PAS domain S-box-containing protein